MSRAVLTACAHSRCGCAYGAECCTLCPLAECVYDNPDLRYAARNEAIKDLRAQGYRVKDLAQQFHLSRETITRVSGR